MSNLIQQNQLTDPAVVARQPLATQAPIDSRAIEWLLVCLAQDRNFLAEARTLVQPYHFHGTESVIRLVFESICISYDRYNGVNYQAVAETASNLIRENNVVYALSPPQLDFVFRNDANGLIHVACNPGIVIDAVQQNFARDLLRRFATERSVIEPLRAMMNPGNNAGNPLDMSALLDVVSRRQQRLSTLTAIPLVDMAPDVGTPLVPSSVFLKTGVDFIDGPLGGQRIGDANGILGPTGGGKTTLGAHLAVASAKQAFAEFHASNTTGGEPGVAVYVTAEEAGMRLRPRFWSNFFRIPRERLDVLTDWNQLSRPGRLLPYELAMQIDQNQKLSELERYMAYSGQLNQCLRVIDISGSEEFPNAGRGYITEVVSFLSRLQVPIRTVIIDYAGLMCLRYMQMKNFDEHSYRSLLKTFGDECRQQISAQFGCTTWILHQLKGTIGNASSTKLMHHTDAGESKDFADNLAVCGCLGVEDKRTRLRQFNLSKVRFRPGDNITPAILRITEFATMEDVSRHYVVDETTRQFIERSEAARISGTEQLTRRAEMSGPAGLVRTGGDPAQQSEL